MTFDLTVIGGGPGGYAAALRAAQLGGKVALVEEKRLGGVCVNVGCIPTKSLLHSVKILNFTRMAGEFGVEVEGVTVDFRAMKERMMNIVGRMRREIEDLLEDNGVQVIYGRGRLLSPTTVKVEGKKVEVDSKAVLIATGSRPAVPQIPGVDAATTTDRLIELPYIPGKVLILGGGPEGVEFATILSELGAQVTLVEPLRSLLPLEDPDVGVCIAQALSRRGVDVKVEASVKAISTMEEGSKAVSIQEGGREEGVQADCVVLAAGRRPNSENLGFEELPVATRDGWIVVDEHMETNIRGVYAVGDVVGGGFVHVAAAQGVVAAGNALGFKAIYDGRVVPRCTYTRPEVAAVGWTEAEAVGRGFTVRVGRASLRKNSRALLTGEVEGFVKIVAEASTGEVLGVHMVGEGLSEVVSEASLLMKLRGRVEDIAGLMHPYPTVSAALNEAALDLISE